MLARTLGDTFTGQTDDSLKQFNDVFIQLKTRFHDRLDLESWKIACTMKNGVLQLVTNTDRLKDIGKPHGRHQTRLEISYCKCS
jgi:hypothetical protein